MLRYIRYMIMLAALAGLLSLISSACDSGGGETAPTITPGAQDSFPVTLESADGRQLTLTAPPQHMVVLSPGHVEILFAIGAGDQVIAVEQNTNYPPEAAAIESKLSGFEPSVEAIAESEPDLVILSFAPDGFLEQMDNLGIPTYLDDIDTKITTVEGVFDSIAELGWATGHATEAHQIISELTARVANVVYNVRGIEVGPTVYHELDVFEGYYSVSPNSFVGDLYHKLKAQNIVGLDEGLYPKLNQEAIIERNPQVIVLADAAFGQTPDVVAARPGWDTIDAITNGRVYAIDPDLVSRPGPRIVNALEELARLLYPELFAPEPKGRYQCLACFAESA